MSVCVCVFITSSAACLHNTSRYKKEREWSVYIMMYVIYLCTLVLVVTAGRHLNTRHVTDSVNVALQ